MEFKFSDTSNFTYFNEGFFINTNERLIHMFTTEVESDSITKKVINTKKELSMIYLIDDKSSQKTGEEIIF
jgi:hypothetical protein